MTNANDKQIGGAHYSGEYQHWDWVFDTRQNYHEARATAYVARFERKNGLEDLLKAQHFLEKCQELYGRTRQRERGHHGDIRIHTKVFCEKNGWHGSDAGRQIADFMASVAYGRYGEARRALKEIIKAYEQKAPTPAPAS
jgi:hypothetical protein